MSEQQCAEIRGSRYIVRRMEGRKRARVACKNADFWKGEIRKRVACGMQGC